jgi:hypothetical protein
VLPAIATPLAVEDGHLLGRVAIAGGRVWWNGRAEDRLRSHLRKSYVADVAGLDELRDRADGLLDRHLRVQARRPDEPRIMSQILEAGSFGSRTAPIALGHAKAIAISARI